MIFAFQMHMYKLFDLLNSALSRCARRHPYNVLIRNDDKPRYRTRKGHIATNVLVVCDLQMQLVHLLPGWEGSARDSHVLRDAVSHVGWIKVPQGSIYISTIFHIFSLSLHICNLNHFPSYGL